jgi:hypothetical protein
MYKMSALVFAVVLSFVAKSEATAAVSPSGLNTSITPLVFAQASGNTQTREFRRCMRQKYGRNYFRGVPRAHRFHMARACGG